MQQTDEHQSLPRSRLAIACILWISVGIIWYVAVRYWLPSHPMPGTAIVVLTSFSAVASAVVRSAGNRQVVGHLSYVTVAFCTVLIVAILALFIICCFYFLYFSKWPDWPTIRYNLGLDVAWIGVHVIAALTVMRLIDRTQLDGY